MRAMVRDGFGVPETLRLEDVPVPHPAAGEVRIAVKAFGINRAETYMRRGTWGDVASISGIECVGTVDLDASGRFSEGQIVAAVMGGLGRTRPGSYAEYTCAPAENVFAVETELPWAALAAIPESYATAWWCLFENLNIERQHVVLIRGATSALGQAALNIAADLGCTVVATTRGAENAALLTEAGAARVIVDGGSIADEVRAIGPVDRVLDVVGNRTLRDSLLTLAPRGRLCQAGFLGGAEPVEAFNPIVDIRPDASLSFFGSFALGTPGYPSARIPMNEIVHRAAVGRYKARPAKVFPLEGVPDAHRLMEANGAKGKIVIEVGGCAGS